MDAQVVQDVLDEINALNDDFQENIRYIVKVRKLTQEKLAESLDVSIDTVKRLFGQKYGWDRNKVIRICLALNLPVEVSSKLLRSASVALNNGNKEDMIIGRILAYCNNISYADKLKILAEHDIFL